MCVQKCVFLTPPSRPSYSSHFHSHFRHSKNHYSILSQLRGRRSRHTPSDCENSHSKPKFNCLSLVHLYSESFPHFLLHKRILLTSFQFSVENLVKIHENLSASKESKMRVPKHKLTIHSCNGKLLTWLFERVGEKWEVSEKVKESEKMRKLKERKKELFSHSRIETSV